VEARKVVEPRFKGGWKEPGSFCILSAESKRYPHPGCFGERVCNWLKIEDLTFLELQESSQEYETKRVNTWNAARISKWEELVRRHEAVGGRKVGRGEF
jgi:hypothetical protein